MDKRAKAMFDKYASFISTNSETTGDIEMLCKYLSYFVSGKNNFHSKFHFAYAKFILGKVTDNSIITEGLFSLSNLMVLFNDQVIRRHLTKGEPRCVSNETEDSIKLFLTVLENVEVLIEITSKQILGNKKKFFIVFLIQAVK